MNTAPAHRIVARACTIREASVLDYDAIATLQHKGGLESKAFADWTHLWLNNPAYEPIKNVWPTGWVLENESHRVVGFIGNIPLCYWFGGDKLTVSAGCSWVVDEAYRGYATWLMDTYFGYPADLFLNTTVGPLATAAFTCFGSTRVPVGAWDSRAFAITNFRGFVQSVLRLRRVPAPGLLGLVVTPVALLFDGFKNRSRSSRNCDVQSTNGFDERFEAFWVELKNNFPNLLLADRSLKTLRWHFGPALARGEVWIATQNSGERLSAYGIFVRRDKADLGLTRMRLADFQSLDGRNEQLIPMLQWAAARCRREGIQALEMIGYDPNNKELTAMLPYRQSMSSWQYYYLARDKTLQASLSNPAAWRPYPYDGDGTL